MPKFDFGYVIYIVIISALVFAWEQGKKMSATSRSDDDGNKVYKLDGALFFGSVSSFKDLFDIHNDPENVRRSALEMGINIILYALSR